MPTHNLTNNITDFTCNGKCSNCGECCSNFLPLSENEIKIIKDYVKKHNIKFCKHTSILSNEIDGICPFRDNVNKKCLIYKIRPEICRSFICNKSRPDIEKSKRLCYENKLAISMWYEIFGIGLSYMEFLFNLLGGIELK